MAYKTIERLIPKSKYALKAPYTMDAEYFTVHNTANDASAQNEISYMSNNSSQTGFHVAIDDKEVIQAIPFDRSAWHCGDGAKGTGNRKSIGIEICYSKSGGSRYAEAEENAVQWLAQQLHARGWDVSRIKQHYDWSQKNCPHRIRNEGRWQSFINRVDAALKLLKSGTKASIAKHRIDEKIGRVNTDDANAFRLQSGRYATEEDALEAARNLIGEGMLGYVTLIGFKE